LLVFELIWLRMCVVATSRIGKGGAISRFCCRMAFCMPWVLLTTRDGWNKAWLIATKMRMVTIRIKEQVEEEDILRGVVHR